ncbi:toxin-antitoxin system YwqK family antitoxin [Winogradskyella bathintestinalis]|uniref:Toxin-antitoxin system YwqK family antitoxin n=1 Tax=Winogradskyella bathintestinalis TaxID=3035208 RepID=A0ABT7ZTX9_9FLAO|nr:toxin-antitoxin system YwqK family antitoxin [Winogradskyella bathintestinalis]MDN3492477.1 toxin-antitoxin system YwqK family antitoxin [Winogradskyella bathintestinalis]
MIKQNIYIILILTLFLTNARAQNPINQFDDNNKRHGLWTKNYHKTSEKRYEGVFDHGKEIDSFKFYTLSNGKSVLSAIKVFNPTDSIADVTFLASTKHVISKGKMNGKRFIGEWIYYHKNSKEKMIVENYNKQGLLEGERKVYFKNGELAEIAHYKNGKLHGASKWFSENGTLLRQATHKDDHLEGKNTNYDAKGNITSEGNYIKSQKKGVWRYYDNGELTKEIDHTKQEVISKNE